MRVHILRANLRAFTTTHLLVYIRGKKKIEEEETYKCKQAVIVRFPFE
jgi:hypothetical protein